MAGLGGWAGVLLDVPVDDPLAEALDVPVDELLDELLDELAVELLAGAGGLGGICSLCLIKTNELE